jgi:hypothetical protein
MKSKNKTGFHEGTVRIKSKNLQAYVWQNSCWRKSEKAFSDALHAVELFKAHNNLKALLDTKNPVFLKGMLLPNGKTAGARINVLPDNTRLNKAFSLFAKNLSIHDETSDSHWDVLYENYGGTFSYVYSISKIKKSVKRKYALVNDFSKYYPKLLKNVSVALNDESDSFALPMYTLLKTRMRVGNEIYYKAHKHKGLTTLKKKDIGIRGSKVTFSFLSKGGVPRKITEKFPKAYILRLKKTLRHLKNNSFVFADKNTSHPLKDTVFKEAFKKYCGKEFYPHIVRSYYATKRAKQFLKGRKHATKEQVNALYSGIAEKLGHKKFVKKKHEWESSYSVTVNHYIQPELVEKIGSISAD